MIVDQLGNNDLLLNHKPLLKKAMLQRTDWFCTFTITNNIANLSSLQRRLRILI